MFVHTVARERRPMLRLPHEGIAGEELLAQLEVLKEHEKRLMDEGKSFGYAYTNGRSSLLCAARNKRINKILAPLCLCT